MNELKYVIVLPGCYSRDQIHHARAIIFNGLFTHKSIGEAAVSDSKGIILSAGFLNIGDNGLVKCYGNSTSLKVGSNPEFDQEICFNTLNRMHPYI